MYFKNILIRPHEQLHNRRTLIIEIYLPEVFYIHQAQH